MSSTTTEYASQLWLFRWYILRKISVVVFELDFLIDIFQRYDTLDRLNVDFFVPPSHFCQQPLAVLLSNIVFNIITILGDKQIITESTDGTIVFKFHSTIISFGGWGEYFDDDGWVRDGIANGVSELRLPTYDDYIRIGVESCSQHFDAHITGVNTAGLSTKLTMK